jgi:hypothetical protein
VTQRLTLGLELIRRPVSGGRRTRRDDEVELELAADDGTSQATKSTAGSTLGKG